MKINLTINNDMLEKLVETVKNVLDWQPQANEKGHEASSDPFVRLKFNGKRIRGIVIDDIEWYVVNDIFNALGIEGVIEREVIRKGISNDTKSLEVNNKEIIVASRFGVWLIEYFCHSENKKVFKEWFSGKASNLYQMKAED